MKLMLGGRRMEIGSKIKKSRIDAKLTQEQAAEALCISRQTISNWENEKSYPDIVSVLKMSDLYGVSLDYLLKGDPPMKNYLDYIEESTNVVKSKVKLSKMILILSYLVIWAFNIMVSWLFSAESITEAQAGAFQWLVLPVATIVISLLIGKNNFWGKGKWFAPIGFGLMFLLSIYVSYGMRENLIFNQIDLQTITLFFIGAIASVLGIVLGYAFFTVEKNTTMSE